VVGWGAYGSPQATTEEQTWLRTVTRLQECAAQQLGAVVKQLLSLLLNRVAGQ
jgi:hypothetical protein